MRPVRLADSALADDDEFDVAHRLVQVQVYEVREAGERLSLLAFGGQQAQDASQRPVRQERERAVVGNYLGMVSQTEL